MHTGVHAHDLTRFLPLGGLAAIGLVLAPFHAVAQDEEVVEEIIVIGSRIARDPNLTGALPVQTVTSEKIQLSGEFEISDVINDIPALMSSVTSENNVQNANLLDLRGLGLSRTLVLVNGRRHVGGVAGSSAVDKALSR